MKKIFIKIFSFLGVYNRIKLLRDRYFKNPVQKKIDKKLQNFYAQLVKPGDLCFDVGASYGYRTETFLNLGARVIAVEPQSQPADFLKIKFDNNIELIQKALGDKNEHKQMLISSAGALSSLSEDWVKEVKKRRFKSEIWKKKIGIEVTTLEDLIKQYGVPDFCKIDVEGYEYEVLQGLKRPVRLLSFEFTIPEFTDRAIMCINHLKRLGDIECNYSSGESLKFGLDNWMKPNEFITVFKDLPTNKIIDGDIYVKFT